MSIRSTIILMSLAIPAAAFAQTNIDATNKFAWGENIGWMNWRDSGSPVGAQGAFIGTTFCAGFLWCENVGYVNLGDGTPANGSSYANATGADFGVNRQNDNRLGGLAWGENIGWINFGPFATLPAAQQARFDSASGRLRGFAWGENIGWINLDDAQHFVAINCAADYNHDGVVDFFDYLDFVQDFAANAPASDFNLDGVIDFFDYLDFVQAFSAGC
jgi:hypothetical protein